MRKPTSNTQSPRFSHRRCINSVYLVIFALTMVCKPLAFATPSESELIAKIPSEKHSEILYMLLSAELAATRNMPKLALKNYLDASVMTGDAAIAEQSTQLAINFQAPHEAVISAELWAKAATTNLQAQLIAVTLFIGQSIDKATPYLIHAIEIDSEEVYQHILEIQSRLSEKSAQNLKVALSRIAAHKPKNANIQLIAAGSAALQEDIKEANQLVDSALKINPDLTLALELKARLIRFNSKSDLPALNFLANHLQKFSSNKELRLFYAKALLDNKQTKESKTQLLQLTSDKLFGGPALLLLGEIYIKENQKDAANASLHKALIFPDSKEGAQYLLGELEESKGNLTAAIRWYSEISQGAYHIQAVLRAIALLKAQNSYQEAISLLHNSTPTTLEEQKHLLLIEVDLLNANKQTEEAMQLAEEILIKLPDDNDVLFMHAITATKLKKWDSAENNLKKILKENPSNASALNALGYTLSFNKDRLDEALNYSMQALKLAPNNPSFMDSVGWTYYLLGNLQQATAFLEKANKLSDDSEIAAHFGEVLWMDHHQDAAIAVWQKALRKNPDHQALLDTLKRLNVEPKGFQLTTVNQPTK